MTLYLSLAVIGVIGSCLIGSLDYKNPNTIILNGKELEAYKNVTDGHRSFELVEYPSENLKIRLSEIGINMNHIEQRCLYKSSAIFCKFVIDV